MEQARADNARSQDQAAATAKQLDSLQDQLASLRRAIESAKQDAAAAREARAAAEVASRRDSIENQALKAKLAEFAPDHAEAVALADAAVPEEIRRTFANALANRAAEFRRLESQMHDTPSKAEARSLAARLEQLKGAPLRPPALATGDLSLDQVGPLGIAGYFRVDEIVNDSTIIVTPVKVDVSAAGYASGSDRARVDEENPIVIGGIPTGGYATGSQITDLPGLFWVRTTQRYGPRTIFCLAPYDAGKFWASFNLLRAEQFARDQSRAAQPRRSRILSGRRPDAASAIRFCLSGPFSSSPHAMCGRGDVEVARRPIPPDRSDDVGVKTPHPAVRLR